MSYQNIFKRYELKFLITKEQQRNIEASMQDYMQPDKFKKSTINNIYFDTPNKLLVRRSNEKPVYKEKLRLRSYGTASPESTVFIELKKKYDGVVYKRRIAMSERESMNYLCKGLPPVHATQITKEIDYFYQVYKDLKPSVFLSYEREAFYSKADKDFRITFDENILYRNYDLSLTSKIYGELLLQKGMVLLEVKTTAGIPLWLTGVLSTNNVYKTSFSKYGSAYNLMLISSVSENGVVGGMNVA